MVREVDLSDRFIRLIKGLTEGHLNMLQVWQHPFEVLALQPDQKLVLNGWAWFGRCHWAELLRFSPWEDPTDGRRRRLLALPNDER